MSLPTDTQPRTQPATSSTAPLGRAGSSSRSGLTLHQLGDRTAAGLTLLGTPRRDRIGRLVVDCGALLVLYVLVALSFQLAFGGRQVWIATLGGAALGLGIGVLGALRRLPTWQVAVLVVAGYLLFGGLLAIPAGTTWGVPGLDTLSELVLGAVTAWKGLLTVDAPVEGIGALLVVPLLTALLTAVVGASVALRSSRPTLAWTAPAAACAVGISFGISQAYQPVLIGVGFALLTITWTAHRRDAIAQSTLGQRRSRRWQSALLAAGVLGLAAVVAVLSAPLVGASDYRVVLRDRVDPPLQRLDYPSPLQSFRGNLSEHEDDTMLTLTGMPEGAAVRVATLDAYDGITFDVADAEDGTPDSGLFKRMGRTVPVQTEGTAARVGVTVGDYTGVWLPSVGEITGAEFGSARGEELADALFYNRASGTGISTAGLRPGDAYTLDVVVPRQPTTDEIEAAEAGEAELPAAEPVPDAVADLARQWAGGATTRGEAVLAVEQELRRGFYSNGLEGDAPSLSGHSVSRIQALLGEDQMIGDEEQYAVAMALAARSLGVPSRVVYGYQPESSGEVAIRGADVTAWTEVQLAGLGWVVLAPTPDKSRAPEPDESQREARPRPQVDNPPPPPERPDYPPADNTPPEEPTTEEDDPDQVDWGLVLRVAAAIGIPLLLLGVPLALVLGLKARRRNGRLLAATTSARVAGGWSEIVDRARDLGFTPPATGTRSEVARTVTERFAAVGEAPVSPRDLAWRADVSTFGPRQPSDTQVELYWQGVDEVRRAMGRSVGWWRRLRAALSLASLRPWR